MKNTTSTALLDVNFILQQQTASDVFRSVVDDSDFDGLFLHLPLNGFNAAP